MLHGAGLFTYIWAIFRANVGKYSSTMEHMGMCSLKDGYMLSLLREFHQIGCENDGFDHEKQTPFPDASQKPTGGRPRIAKTFKNDSSRGLSYLKAGESWAIFGAGIEVDISCCWFCD
jgi:hypothetical protein